MGTKFTKWPYNITNGRKIEQVAIKYIHIVQCKTLQNLPKLRFFWPSGNPGLDRQTFKDERRFPENADFADKKRN
jgi:hypothetical protein